MTPNIITICNINIKNCIVTINTIIGYDIIDKSCVETHSNIESYIFIGKSNSYYMIVPIEFVFIDYIS